MLDVHPPHHAARSWTDFFIHLATITAGLLIAIGLEQSVEALHNLHERHQLEADLQREGEKNVDTITRDLRLFVEAEWFQGAQAAADGGAARDGFVSFSLTRAPCAPGTVSDSVARYIMPSDAVWTAARESNRVGLLPVDEARMYARLAHNFQLLTDGRNHMAAVCERILAMQARFSSATAAGTRLEWHLRPEHASEFAETASEAAVALRGLMFRLRFLMLFEEGILKGNRDAESLARDLNSQVWQALPRD
jgi:hypothetical protein